MATAIGAIAVAIAECRKNGADDALMVPMPPQDADRRTLLQTGVAEEFQSEKKGVGKERRAKGKGLLSRVTPTFPPTPRSTPTFKNPKIYPNLSKI